jgi:hypothetical protein
MLAIVWTRPVCDCELNIIVQEKRILRRIESLKRRESWLRAAEGISPAHAKELTSFQRLSDCATNETSVACSQLSESRQLGSDANHHHLHQ